ncbi:Myb DNA-bind 5 domain-containing protein [Aphis craccivora]|uniref:Regulatory protein zeste n=1 Tax=Aphis craccivora TaxID=307492 RepID=A0A6G0W0W0_APHCR|nr:Myb DNA-bind 5 domain-containing protein [Aphis craccivora]
MSKSRPTQFQMKSLVEFMTKDPLLCAGKFNQNFTHKTAQKKWEMITAELNTLPGAEKSWDKWKKTEHLPRGLGGVVVPNGLREIPLVLS